MKRKLKIRFNKRSGGEKRGNSKDRKVRKHWMLSTYGTGNKVPCTHCGRELDYYTVEADRIEPGGSYRRENIVPSCHKCNVNRHLGISEAEREEQMEIEAAMRDWASRKRAENTSIKTHKNPRKRYNPSKRVRKSKVKIYFKRRVR